MDEDNEKGEGRDAGGQRGKKDHNKEKVPASGLGVSSSSPSSASNLSPSKALELPPAIEASPKAEVLESVGERRNRLPPLAGASAGLAANRRLSAPVVLREQREQILSLKPTGEIPERVGHGGIGGGGGSAVMEEKIEGVADE